MIRKNTAIGKYNTIYSYASINSTTQHIGYKAQESWLKIKNRNKRWGCSPLPIRGGIKFVTINVGPVGPPRDL